jgi:hypothetical protein
MDFIASYTVDVSVEGWIWLSLELSLCDCDAYTNLLTALVLPTFGNLKTISIWGFRLKNFGVVAYSGVWRLCSCWSISYFLHIPAQNVAFHEEGNIFLRNVWSHWSKNRSL